MAAKLKTFLIELLVEDHETGESLELKLKARVEEMQDLETAKAAARELISDLGPDMVATMLVAEEKEN